MYVSITIGSFEDIKNCEQSRNPNGSLVKADRSRVAQLGVAKATRFTIPDPGKCLTVKI